MLGGDLIGGIALKIAGRKNPCDYALIAVGLAEVMEEEEQLLEEEVLVQLSPPHCCHCL